jgi:hypothetical protein
MEFQRGQKRMMQGVTDPNSSNPSGPDPGKIMADVAAQAALRLDQLGGRFLRQPATTACARLHETYAELLRAQLASLQTTQRAGEAVVQARPAGQAQLDQVQQQMLAWLDQAEQREKAAFDAVNQEMTNLRGIDPNLPTFQAMP